jgi:hypothetical protein
MLLLTCVLWDSSRSYAQEDLQPDDPYARQTVIGYASVREALEALKAKPDVTIVTRRDGWVIVTEPRPYAQWSFTPEGHYAHPAVVRLTIQQSPNGEVKVETAALCGAEQAACEKLMAEFRRRN